MFTNLREFFEFLWLYIKGFRPVEFVRGEDRLSLHACGWRANGSGRMRRAKDAVALLEDADREQWRQVYCGMTPFLVSDKGNVKHLDGKPVKLFLANGRYQIFYKPEGAPRGRGKNGHIHKKRVYRSMLVAMAFLDFKKGDAENEIHHINGYRTDDRLINLMVLSHEEHLRIHNLGPCGLSGRKDAGAMADAAQAEATAAKKPLASGKPQPQESAKKNASGTDASNGTADERTAETPSKKRRRRKKSGAARKAPQTTAVENATGEALANENDGAQAAGEHDEMASKPEGACMSSAHAPAESPACNEGDGAASDAHSAQGGSECKETCADEVCASEQETLSKSQRKRRRRKAAAARRATEAETAVKERRNEADGDTEEHANEPVPQNQNEQTEQTDEAPRERANAQKKEMTARQAPRPEQPAQAQSAAKQGAGAQAELDWVRQRAKLESSIRSYLEKSHALQQAGENEGSKKFSSIARPTYKALKPFLTCNDAVTQFDTALSCLRIIAADERERAALEAVPHSTHSLTGALQKLMKTAVRTLSKGDEVERACVGELLHEEAAKKDLYSKANIRALRQCISVVESRSNEPRK